MTAINEQWLRDMGFRWEQGERQPTKHWLLWIADACTDPVETGRKMFASNEDLGIEIVQLPKPRKERCYVSRANVGNDGAPQ